LSNQFLATTAPDVLLVECDKLARTRGAVMAVARLDAAGELSMSGVGNVGAHVCGPGPPWRFGGSSFVLGSPGGVRRVPTEKHHIAGCHVLVLFSEGVRSRFDLAGELDLLREHRNPSTSDVVCGIAPGARSWRADAWFRAARSPAQRVRARVVAGIGSASGSPTKSSGCAASMRSGGRSRSWACGQPRTMQ
jgi:hypothetical protein